ncbi:B2 protein [Senna tora]|uniref:B2 protein n=1 Tax=Senna tora TaxID=362788 RepID=A0A834TNH8_9FABA|nr:B2 protein [Senna tora]
MDPYDRDYERDHLHRLEPIYRDTVPAHRETLRADPPPYINEAYRHGARHEYANDPYHHAHHYGASSSRDSYMAPLSREEIPSSSYLVSGRTSIGTERLRRAEAAEDRLYSTYAADALSDYNRSQHYNGVHPEATSLPVSSRYSFAGPSYSYR